MFTIGEFAKLSGITVKALHHYDDLGLLTPALVDPINGYRLYNSEQLTLLNQILALKASGFSLKEIKVFISRKDSVKELTEMMLARLGWVENEISRQQAQAEHLRRQIFRIQNGGLAMDQIVVVKSVEPILVASIRHVVQDYKEMLKLWEELNHEIEAHGIKKAVPCMTLYHNGWDTRTDIDITVVEPLIKSFAPKSGKSINEMDEKVAVITLPAVSRMASIVHQGSFDTIGQTYNQMEQWLLEQNETLTGPIREIYHEGDWSTNDPDQYVTEIQFPLKASEGN